MGKLKNFESVPIGELVKADWNYKQEDEDIKNALKANIKRNGQVENIVIRELDTGFKEIVNGNHRYDALVELGVKDVVCFNVGKITTAAAMRLAVELNETRFPTDRVEIARVFKEMSEEFELTDLSETLPFSLEEIESTIEMLDYDFDNIGDVEPAGEGEDDKTEDGRILKITMSVDDNVKWLEWKQSCKTDSDNQAFSQMLELIK